MASDPMWRRYLRWWGADAAADLDLELQHHMDLLADEYVARGHSRDDALVLARRRLGNLTRIRAECSSEDRQREQATRTRAMWHQLAQDMRFAWRLLVKTPSTTIIAVVTMGLAIGATTAIFSVVYGVLIRPLPYHASDRLVQVRVDVSFQTDTVAMSAADFVAWRADRRHFEDVAVYSGNAFNLTGAGTPESVAGAWASARLFDVLGVGALFGRTFMPDDDRPDAESLAVLSHSFWHRHFGGDPDVVGRSISLNGAPTTIVGILPRGATLPQPGVEVWRNLRLNPARRGPFFLTGVGRLAPGVTLDDARQDLARAKDRVSREYPGPDDWGFAAQPLHEAETGGVRHVLLLLFGAVSLLLLIAIVNVANLLLARATARHHELGVRAALGAGQFRVVRQLLTESLVLAALGGTLGVMLALLGTRLLLALGAERLPRSADVTIDLPVLVFSALLSLGAGLLFGLAPAAQTFGRDIVQSLSAGRRTGTSSRRQHRHQSALVIVQIALATILVSGAALLTRSLVQLVRHDPGFNTERLLTFYLDLPSSRYPAGPQVTRFYDDLLSGLRALPGVQGAGTAVSLPPHLLSLSDNFVLEDRPVPPGETAPVGPVVVVSDDYFETMGIPVRRGRAFTSVDRADSERVAIVSQTLASQYFGHADPVGRRLRTGPPRDDWPWLTIVGVVGDVPYGGLDAGFQPAYYLPASQHAWGDYFVVLRTATDPRAIADAARRTVWSLDSELPVSRVRAMDDVLRESVGAESFRTTLVDLFGLLGLTLASVGIYGVTAYSVSQRRREIGVRIALGAHRVEILQLILGRGMRQAAIGVAAGLAGAFVATRTLSNLLFGVERSDPGTLAAAAAIIIAAATAACAVPAIRATRMDPVTALRQE